MPVARLSTKRVKGGEKIMFKYYSSWLKRGIELSPITAPLKPGVKCFDKPSFFCSLPGFIYENLPTGCWSEQALETYLYRSAIRRRFDDSPNMVLKYLAYVGSLTLGALIFKPSFTPNRSDRLDNLSLEELFKISKPIYRRNNVEKKISSQFFRAAGSMSGIRPKILAAVSKGEDRVFGGLYSSEYGSKPIEGYDPWIIKFTSLTDGPGSGAVEYVYALMAKEAGVEMPDVHLFTNSIEGDCGYFGCKRFDRTNDGKRLHMSCAIAMADLTDGIRNLDYLELM